MLKSPPLSLFHNPSLISDRKLSRRLIVVSQGEDSASELDDLFKPNRPKYCEFPKDCSGDFSCSSDDPNIKIITQLFFLKKKYSYI